MPSSEESESKDENDAEDDNKQSDEAQRRGGERQSEPKGQRRRRLEYSTNPAVHVNIQIHISPDAQPDTVAEIFRNMKRYVLDDAPIGDE